MRNSSVPTRGPERLWRHPGRRGKGPTPPRLALALLAFVSLALPPAAAQSDDAKQEPGASAGAAAPEKPTEKKEGGGSGEPGGAVEAVVTGTPKAVDATATKTPEGQSTAAPGERPAVKKEVKVDGDVPESLLGRWLVLTTLNLPDGPSPNASLLEVTRGADGKVTFEHRNQDLPAELIDAAKAASKAGKDFVPSQEQLADLTANWSKFPADLERPPVRGLKYWFITHDKYTDEFKGDESARDAKAVLIVSRFPIPAPGGRAPVRNDLFFFIKDLTKERLKGPYTNFQLITGFAPVPVTLQGGFTAYRVGTALPSAGSGQAPANGSGSAAQPKSPS
jgi:hypothetical protein